MRAERGALGRSGLVQCSGLGSGRIEAVWRARAVQQGRGGVGRCAGDAALALGGVWAAVPSKARAGKRRRRGGPHRDATITASRLLLTSHNRGPADEGGPEALQARWRQRMPGGFISA